MFRRKPHLPLLFPFSGKLKNKLDAYGYGLLKILNKTKKTQQILKML